VGKGAKPKASAATQGGGSKNKNKKKADGSNQPLAGAPTVVVAAVVAGGGRGPCGDKRPYQASGSDDGGAHCPVHNSTCHSAEECREIKKLVKQYHEQLKQQHGDSAPSHQREGKQTTDPEEDKEDGMGFQKAKRDLKAVYGHSDSESSDNEYVQRLLGHHLPSHHQELASRGGGGRACPKGGPTPQVDGDVNQLRCL
jgi:hypothetical protein